MNNKICIKCKNRVIWKGNKYKRNYWQLYCEECEKKLGENNE